VFRPGFGVAVAVEAVAVAAGGVEQEFVRDFGLQQRGVVDLAADDVALVVVAVDDEGGGMAALSSRSAEGEGRRAEGARTPSSAGPVLRSFSEEGWMDLSFEALRAKKD
jgi:hypothetical protein